MTRQRGGALAVILAAGLIACVIADTVAANGGTQREVQGRVVSVDVAAGTLVVAREFRGRSTQVTLKAAAATRVFACAHEHKGLGHVKPGMAVSAFYEAVGSDGIVNLIVVEPAR